MALFVTRQVGETIIMGDGPGAVRVRLSEYRAGKMRFAISAPDYVAVHREEVWKAILREGYDLDVKTARPPGGGGGNLMLARYPGETLVFVDTREGNEGWRKPLATIRYEPPSPGRHPGRRGRFRVETIPGVRVWGDRNGSDGTDGTDAKPGPIGLGENPIATPAPIARE